MKRMIFEILQKEVGNTVVNFFVLPEAFTEDEQIDVLTELIKTLKKKRGDDAE